MTGAQGSGLILPANGGFLAFCPPVRVTTRAYDLLRLAG